MKKTFEYSLTINALTHVYSREYSKKQLEHARSIFIHGQWKFPTTVRAKSMMLLLSPQPGELIVLEYKQWYNFKGEGAYIRKADFSNPLRPSVAKAFASFAKIRARKEENNMFLYRIQQNLQDARKENLEFAKTNALTWFKAKIATPNSLSKTAQKQVRSSTGQTTATRKVFLQVCSCERKQSLTDEHGTNRIFNNDEEN